MQIVLGVDDQERHLPAVRLLRRLQFSDATVELVHVAEPTPATAAMNPVVGIPPDVWHSLLRDYHQRAEALLARVRPELESVGIPTQSRFKNDFSATQTLLKEADTVHADLIAVGSSEKKLAWLTGSVGRGVVSTARCSVLIGKGIPNPEGPIHAVLATDHSEYANRCIDELLRLAPRGLKHLTVVTSYPADDLKSFQPLVADLNCDLAESIAHRLGERNAELLPHLAPLGCALESRVIDAPHANDAIHVCMAETGADLLILGAQGHGFWERLTLGSVSFHQAFAETYPVLVLRVPEAGRPIDEKIH